MYLFGLTFLCFQACLVQNVYGQVGCYRNAYVGSPYGYTPGLLAGVRDTSRSSGFGGPYGYGTLDLTGPVTGLFPEEFATGPIGAYGGVGVGDITVAGGLPADGAAVVSGQVPILGAVEFAGPIQAAGTVTIAGTCECGYGGPLIY